MSKQDKTKVTRIKADEPSAKPKKAAKPAAASKVKAAKAKPARAKRQRSYGIFGKIGGYFKGAWFELRQVHWPTRSATWGLTGAVLLFSAFFVVFITLLDAGFKYVFEQILR